MGRNRGIKTVINREKRKKEREREREDKPIGNKVRKRKIGKREIYGEYKSIHKGEREQTDRQTDRQREIERKR